MIEDFLLRALLAGMAVAAAAGPLGCFIVWRRLAYFGDTMAHAALLGVALGFLVGLHPGLGVVAVTVAVALFMLFRSRRRQLSGDAMLGILSHTTLAMGLVAAGVMSGLRVDLMSYLFGDILAISADDLIWIYAGAVLVIAALAAIWRPLLALSVHEDMARAEGMRTRTAQIIFMLLIALVIAGAMQIVGILLITSLLIIPAATARRFSGSPEAMAVAAGFLGMLAVAGGLMGSLWLDTPSGPSVVLAAATLFLLTVGGATIAGYLRRNRAGRKGR